MADSLIQGYTVELSGDTFADDVFDRDKRFCSFDREIRLNGVVYRGIRAENPTAFLTIGAGSETVGDPNPDLQFTAVLNSAGLLRLFSMPQASYNVKIQFLLGTNPRDMKVAHVINGVATGHRINDTNRFTITISRRDIADFYPDPVFWTDARQRELWNGDKGLEFVSDIARGKTINL